LKSPTFFIFQKISFFRLFAQKTHDILINRMNPVERSTMLRTDIFSDFMKHFHFAPTHSVVINLVKARKHDQTIEPVDEVVAEKTFHSIRRALTKKCVSKANYRRFTRLIYAVASVERSNDNRPHLHILLRKPDHLTHNLFREAILETAKHNPYVYPEKRYTVDITNLIDISAEHYDNLIPYSFKQIDKQHSAFLM
jgi:hypothetical protein